MKIIAGAKYLRGSPRKARLIAMSVRGMLAKSAVDKLKLASQKQAEPLVKVLKQGMANAENNFKISHPESLKISKIEIGDGPRMKRQDKSHGARFDQGIIQKKFYHLKVVLESEEENGKQG